MAKTTQDALVALASVCDGASTHDGAGFSGADTDFGRDLASKGREYGWTEKQHGAAKRLCHKYRKQLRNDFGFDPDALASEEFAAVKQRQARAAQAPAGALGYVRPTKPIDGFPNKFPGRCGCGTRVEVGFGRCTKQDGRWVTYCSDCSEPTRAAEIAESTEQARQACEPMVHIRAVGPDGEDIGNGPARAQARQRARAGARWGYG